MASTLKQKAMSGMIWTALQRYSTIFIQFVSGIILARLLTPYDYGCIGMLMIFMVLAESFIDGGFGSALIQKKRPTQEDYSTVFFWNLGMAVLLYVVLYLSAPFIARFYDIPLLCSILRVQGVILFVYAFNIVQRNQLQKKLNFKVLSIVTITTSIVSLTVTIVMAYYGFGVWSLVVQNIITAVIPALVLWFYVKWRPMFVFSAKSFKELFSFGSFMFLTSTLNQLGNELQGLLIGRFYNPSTMGLYSKAYSTERLASVSISQIMSQVTYPLYAEAQDNKALLVNMIKQLSMAVSYITYPFMFVLFLCAKPLFVWLYSDKWVGSVPYFQILCLAGLALCLQSINHQAVSAIGKSKALFTWTLVKRFVGISFVVIGLILYGIKGLLVGIVFDTWFSYFVNICMVSKYVGYRWWRQLLDILPIAVVSVIVAMVCYIVGEIWKFPLYYDGIVKLCLYLSLYWVWSLAFKPKGFLYCKGAVFSILTKIVKRI